MKYWWSIFSYRWNNSSSLPPVTRWLLHLKTIILSLMKCLRCDKGI